jgi:hypothetical protein
LTTDTVKTRLHRARATVRQKLDCYLRNRCIDVEPIATPSPLSERAWSGGRPVIWVTAFRFRPATVKTEVADMPIAATPSQPQGQLILS